MGDEFSNNSSGTKRENIMKFRLGIFKLIAAIISWHRKNLIISASIDLESETITIWFADFKWVRLGLEWFSNPNCGYCADFDDMEIIDNGNTLRLGEFEAASDCIRDVLDERRNS